MKNKDKSRELVKRGVVMHLKRYSLKKILFEYQKSFIKNNFENRDKAFVKNLTMVSIRNRGFIEFILSKHLNRALPKTKIEIKALLIMGVAQILFTRVAKYAAVNSSVNFFKGNISKWRPLANALLRRIASDEENIKNEYDKSLNIPSWLYKSWIDYYGKEKTKNITEAILLEPYIDIKIKNNFDYWFKKIEGEALFNNTIRIIRRGDISNIKGYEQGAWWVQNIAAQIPVMLFKNIKNEEVLDLCASPGGKTAQLLSAGAKIISVDISQERVKLLINNLNRLQLRKNISIHVKDIRKWKPQKKVNKILIDVPCSATGTARQNPDVFWNKTREDILRLSLLQKNLLEAAIDMLNTNGIILYCNCSLQKEEGEDVIKYILKKKRVKLDPIINNEINDFPKEIINNGMIRTLPYILKNKGGMDGFFVARLIKI